MVSPKCKARNTREDTVSKIQPSHNSRRSYSLHHFIVFTFTFVVTLVVYMKTLSPSIAGGDSGELVAEGCQLGTAHPPGYPLYDLLVYLVTSIGKSWIVPITTYEISPVVLVNALSSLLGAATSGLIASTMFLLVEDDIDTLSTFVSACCAIAIGLLHSFSPMSWQYSVTAEVFALHNFFVAWIIHTAIQLVVQYHSSHNTLLYRGALIAALAMTNQHTSILLLVPVICFVMHWAGLSKAFLIFPSPIQYKVVYKARWVLGRCAFLFLVILSVMYSTLPIFSSFYPHAGSWGDVSSLSGFIRHVLRRDYGTLRLFSGNDQGSEGLFERTKHWCIDFATIQCNKLFFTGFIFSFIRYFVLAFGKKGNYTDQRAFGGLIISISLLFYLIVFHNLSNLPLKNPLFYGIHQRFWLHPNVLAFILGGDGINRLILSVLKRGRGSHLGAKSTASVAILSWFFFVRGSFLKNYHNSDHSTNVFFRNYATSILDSLPNGSLLLINYDQQWTSIRYMQECENKRRDITSINLSMMTYPWWKVKRRLYPNIHFPGYYYGASRTRDTFTFSELVRKNYKSFQGNIFIGGQLSYPDPNYSGQFDEIPHGFVRRIQKRVGATSSKVTTLWNANDYRKESLSTWIKIVHVHRIGLPDLKKFPSSTWEWTIRREFLDHFLSRATHLLDLAVTEEVALNQDDHLLSLLESAYWLEISRFNDEYAASSPSLYRNLGLAYMHMVRSKANSSSAQILIPSVSDIFAGTNNSHMSQKVHDTWYNTTLNTGKSREWKDWASQRWNFSWGYYLQMDKAKNDSAYEQIQSIYHAVHKSLPRH